MTVEDHEFPFPKWRDIPYVPRRKKPESRVEYKLLYSTMPVYSDYGLSLSQTIANALLVREEKLNALALLGWRVICGVGDVLVLERTMTDGEGQHEV